MDPLGWDWEYSRYLVDLAYQPHWAPIWFQELGKLQRHPIISASASLYIHNPHLTRGTCYKGTQASLGRVGYRLYSDPAIFYMHVYVVVVVVVVVVIIATAAAAAAAADDDGDNDDDDDDESWTFNMLFRMFYTNMICEEIIIDTELL